MQYIEIYDLNKDAKPYTVVTATLVGDKVQLSGDKNMCQKISKYGIVDFSSPRHKKLYHTSEGNKFLEQLSNNFNSTYLTTSPILYKKG